MVRYDSFLLCHIGHFICSIFLSEFEQKKIWKKTCSRKTSQHFFLVEREKLNMEKEVFLFYP